jgi:hypothetical protein
MTEARTRTRSERLRCVLMRLACGVSVLVSAFLNQGCDTGCEVGEGPPVEFHGGEVSAAGTFYQTSDWDGPLLYFPSDRRFEIFHGLGTKDLAVTIDLAFDAHGSPEDHGVAPSAGNQAVIEGVDERRIVVHNDVCSQFYLRLTAQAAGRTGSSDAGSD